MIVSRSVLNRFAKQSAALRPFVRNDLSAPALKELSTLDDERFRKHFSGTPIKRTGRDRFLRNVLIAMGNSGDDAMVSAIAPHLNDASALVRVRRSGRWPSSYLKRNLKICARIICLMKSMRRHVRNGDLERHFDETRRVWPWIFCKSLC